MHHGISHLPARAGIAHRGGAVDPSVLRRDERSLDLPVDALQRDPGDAHIFDAGIRVNLETGSDEHELRLGQLRNHGVVDIAFRGDQPFLVGADPRVRRCRSIENIQDLLRRHPISFDRRFRRGRCDLSNGSEGDRDAQRERGDRARTVSGGSVHGVSEARRATAESRPCYDFRSAYPSQSHKRPERTLAAIDALDRHPASGARAARP